MDTRYLDIYEVGGSEESTKRLQRKYVKYFQNYSKVLDIGCGKGFFLELLKENGISAEGIDTEEEMVKICCKKGFKVFQSEALSFLEDKIETYNGIFCSHIIEHMMPEKVLNLFRLCFSALKSEGMLVVITPNFGNLDVATERFWMDISHIRPYPLILLEKMLSHTGFKIIEKGEDKDTKPKYPIWKRPLVKIRRLLFGDFWGRGYSIFIVGTK
jgi:2-polyprenyl-3-methyl-5-hydroxy-6-metoxy-1,4-benzoquinol methylase